MLSPQQALHPCRAAFAICPLLVVFGWLLAGSARAEIQFDVFLGFDQNISEAAWFPATIEVMNDGPPFQGAIEVSSGYGRTGQRVIVPVELPTRTLKRVVIPLFNGSAGYSSWNFELVDERGRRQAERPNLRPRREILRHSRLIAALPRTAAGVPILPELPPQQNDRQAAVGRLTPDLFPDNPLVLEGLGAIYLNSQRALELKTPQVNALLAWLHSGGHLIIAVDQPADVNATPWLRELLPCSLGSLTAIRAGNDLQRWLPTPSTPPPASPPGPPAVTNTAAKTAKTKKTRPPAGSGPLPLPTTLPDEVFSAAEMPVVLANLRDGQPVLSAGEVPLVIQGRRGRGSISVLTFNPEREPFLSWKHRSWFWVQLTQVPTALWTQRDWQRHGSFSFDGVFGSIIDSRQAGKMPLTGLLLLLVGYLLVIGPGDRWLVRRLNREMLTWITFPLYVAGFSLLIYLIGFALRAGETEWNELHLVDVVPRTSESVHLRGRTFGSVYSSGNRAYSFRDDPANAYGALRMELAGLSGADMGSTPGRILRDGNRGGAQINVPVWSSQMLVNDWTRGGSPPFRIEATKVNGTNGWAVQNLLKTRLKEVRVVSNNQVFKLGPLGPGERKVLIDHAPENLDAFLGTRASDFQRAVQFRQNTFGSQQRPEIAPLDAAIAASFPERLRPRDEGWGIQQFQATQDLDLGRLPARDEAVLFALVESHAPIAPLNQFNARRTARQTVYRAFTSSNPTRHE